MADTCFACGRRINGEDRYRVDTRDGQRPYVGPDCYVRIRSAGVGGYQPVGQHGAGGPRLWICNPDEFFTAMDARITTHNPPRRAHV